MSLNVSVIICCHNSAPRLRPTLEHLAGVRAVSGLAWEVVLVDNGSTDGTADLANALWAEFGAPAPLRIVGEPQLGLIHARKRGVNSARYDLLSFIDDDNWVSAGWLEVIHRVFDQQPLVGALGGWGEAAFDDETGPDWFAELQHGFACGKQAKQSGPVSAARGGLYGAGATFRAQALRDLRDTGFDHFFVGRLGDTLLSGDDTELCLALAARGWTLWYDEDLRFKHYMPAGRMTDAYVLRLFASLGFTAGLLEAYYVAFDMRPKYWRMWHSVFATSALSTLWALLRTLARPGRTRGSVEAKASLAFIRGRLKARVLERRRYNMIVATQSAYLQRVGRISATQDGAGAGVLRDAVSGGAGIAQDPAQDKIPDKIPDKVQGNPAKTESI